MRQRHFAFLSAFAVSSALFVNWCAVLFQCGCRSLWNGISTHCNIHAAAGPSCPWCEHPFAGGGVAFLALVLAQYAVVYRVSPTGFWRKAGLALAVFPVATGIVGLAQGWIWGYWTR